MEIKTNWTNNELEDLLRQLGLVLEASRIGIWQHNIKRNQTYWDDQLKSIYGVPKGPLDVVWLNSVHPDDVALTSEIFQMAIAQKSDYASEFRIIRPDGSIRHLRSRAKYFVGANGDPCFMGGEWDVTEDVERNLQLERSQAEARFAADHDFLTGLRNRRSFDATLASLSEHPKTTVSVCHIDIDHFKEINDRFGHAGGDLVLCHIAKILSDAIDPADVAARLGGDEFAILIREASEEKVGNILLSVRAALDCPLFVEHQTFNIRCSIGVATAASDDVEKLLAQSDMALYEAKRNGRNRLEFYTEELANVLASERQILADLRVGLAEGQIIPFYQVQVLPRTFVIAGLEALARWRHPTKGLLAPAQFLDVASAHGLTKDIDSAVLRGVLSDLKSWSGSGLSVPRISVNVSAERLADPCLLQTLCELNLPKSGVSFELIETIILDSLGDQIKRNIDGIRALGIEIEIDDLGSGHASLLGLVELRPNRVKIDRHLVSPILASAPSQQLIKSLVDIARTLNIEVVAEGVETLGHAEALANIGVDILQGYAFGAPEAAKAIEARLHPAIEPDTGKAAALGVFDDQPRPIGSARPTGNKSLEASPRNGHSSDPFARVKAEQQSILDAVHNMADGLAIFDQDGYLSFINPQYAKMFPVTEDIRKPGIHFLDILQASVERGEEPRPDGSLDAWKQRVFANLRKPGARLMEFCDGRAIEARWGVSESGNIFVNYSNLTKAKQAERQFIELTAKLEALAATDGLTGLANRRGFDEAIERKCADAARLNMPLSLLMIDVDSFKLFNDTYGHPRGDACLKAIASEIAALSQSQGGYAARYGGEELAVILPRATGALAGLFCQAISRSINSLSIPHIAENGIVTVSIGVGSAEGQGARDPARLVASADKALYAAKADGRNCYRVVLVSEDREDRLPHVIERSM